MLDRQTSKLSMLILTLGGTNAVQTALCCAYLTVSNVSYGRLQLTCVTQQRQVANHFATTSMDLSIVYKIDQVEASSCCL